LDPAFLTVSVVALVASTSLVMGLVAAAVLQIGETRRDLIERAARLESLRTTVETGFAGTRERVATLDARIERARRDDLPRFDSVVSALEQDLDRWRVAASDLETERIRPLAYWLARLADLAPWWAR
jgi:hypothetical protein